MRALSTRILVTIAILAGAVLSASVHAQPMRFTTEPFPPFTFDKEGVVVGPVPEIVHATCAWLQIECEFKMYPWRRAYQLAERGQADGIFVLQRLSEREKAFYFTDAVIGSSFGVFAQTTSRLRYSMPWDLNVHIVGVYGPSATSTAAEEVLRAALGANLVLEVDNPTVLKKLAGGRYGSHGAAVMNTDVGRYLLNQNKITGIEFAGEVKKIEYAIGLSKRKLTQAQFERFNNAVRELSRNGTIDAIVEKYGMTAPSRPRISSTFPQ